MADIIDYPDRPSWLAARSAGLHPIGSSDVPRMLGSSPYGGPWSLWADRTHPQGERRATEAMAAGLADEPHALAIYAWQRGPVEHVPYRLCTHAAHPWARCSPDALVYDADGWLAGGVEVKHLEHEDRHQWADSGAMWTVGDGPPPCPLWVAQQAGWCATVMGVGWWDVCAALWSGRRYPDVRIYRLYVPAEVAAALLWRVGDWRLRHLVEGIEPPPDTPAERRESVELRHPQQVRAEVVDADATAAAALAEYGAARDARVAAEAREDAARAAVCEVIGDGRGVRSSAWSATWGTAGTTDRLAGLSRIREARPDLADLLTEAGLIQHVPTSRRLTLTRRKEVGDGG